MIPLDKLASMFDWRCVKCDVLCVAPTGKNLPNEATLDHIFPVSLGGENEWINAQLMCRDCNTKKNNTRPMLWCLNLNAIQAVCDMQRKHSLDSTTRVASRDSLQSAECDEPQLPAQLDLF